MASKHSLLPGAAQGLSEGTTLRCWYFKLKILPAAVVVLLEEVFQVKCFSEAAGRDRLCASDGACCEGGK